MHTNVEMAVLLLSHGYIEMVVFLLLLGNGNGGMAVLLLGNGNVEIMVLLLGNVNVEMTVLLLGNGNVEMAEYSLSNNNVEMVELCAMVPTYMVMNYSSSIYTDFTRQPPSKVEHMHYSLGGAGLGRTLVSCVLSVCRSGRVCSGSRSIAPWPASSSLRVPSSQALTLLGGARFIVWRLRLPILRGMPTELEAFLKPPGMSELWPYARTLLKKALCHSRPVGVTCDKYRKPSSCLTVPERHS